jgi:uroporphyrinogen-III synthase
MVTVLLTRPYEDNLALAHQLEPMDIVTLNEPMLTMLAVPFLPSQPQYDAVLITSKHALIAAYTLEQPKLIVVGEQCAQKARDMGFEQVEVAGDSADALLEYVMHYMEPEANLLYLSGEHISTPIDELLYVQGFEVERQVVYEAQATDEITEETLSEIATQTIDFIPFFSERTARIFTQLIEEYVLTDYLRTIKPVCFSPAIAESLDADIWDEIIIAKEPKVDCVIDAIMLASAHA